MPSRRYTESLIRQIVDALFPNEPKEAILKRIKQLQRGLEPENESALILSWLGECRLVHKLWSRATPSEFIRCVSGP